MDYALKVDNESEKEIEISVPVADLDIYLERETEKLRREVAIKGFRKGKVPKDVIKTKFKDTIKANALNDLIAKSYLTLLQERKWQPAAPVQLLNVEEGEQIKFRMRLEVVPDFKVDHYMGLEIIKEKPLPPEYLIDEALNNIKESSATVQEAPRPAVVDDFVTLDLTIVENSDVKSNESDVMIRIGDRNFPDEVNRALVGSKKGQHMEVKVNNQLYKMSIKKIEEKILPLIDDNLAKGFGFENLDSMKKKLTEDLIKREQQRIEDDMKENLARVILERTHFNTPKALVNEEYQDIIKKDNLPDSDATKERFWDVAEKRVRFNLILDRIALKDNIVTDDSEITGLIEKMGLKLNEENRLDIIGYFRKILTRQKTVDYLLKHAKISEKGRIISPKEASDANRTVRH